jgi:hypothetical protein
MGINNDLPPYVLNNRVVCAACWNELQSLSNRTYDDYNPLLAEGTDAYRQLTPEGIRTVCACPYLERASQA